MSSYVTMAATEAHRQDLLRVAESTYGTPRAPRLRFTLFERARRASAETRRTPRLTTRRAVATAAGR